MVKYSPDTLFRICTLVLLNSRGALQNGTKKPVTEMVRVYTVDLFSVFIPVSRKTKNETVFLFPITAFNMKCDKWLTNLFPHSLLHAVYEKPFVFRFPRRYAYFKNKKNGKRKTIVGVSFSVFRFHHVQPIPCNNLFHHVSYTLCFKKTAPFLFLQ